MGERESIFNAKEMRIIEITCDQCGTGVVFDSANEGGAVPIRCPGCNAEDQQMFSWLLGYRKGYQAITSSQKVFKFRVPEKQP
jgi:hypothetical protein